MEHLIVEIILSEFGFMRLMVMDFLDYLSSNFNPKNPLIPRIQIQTGFYSNNKPTKKAWNWKIQNHAFDYFSNLIIPNFCSELHLYWR